MASGKYARLHDFLSRKHGPVRLAFTEIERGVLGFSLPASARKHRPWWSNDAAHSQARTGWLTAGYRVGSVDMPNQQVHFEPAAPLDSPDSLEGPLTGHTFEGFARPHLEDHYGTLLRPGRAPGVPKLFDYTSETGRVVGDAKYMTLVHGQTLPPAKFSVIAEHVWLLQKCSANRRFLVFGNDRRVAERWLQRYGHLAEGVAFHFVTDEGKFETLKEE